MAANDGTGTALGLQDIQSGDPRVHTNQIKVPKERLVDIIRLYRVFDLLGCEFLFPAYPRQVAITRFETGPNEDWVNMADVLATIPALSQLPASLNPGGERLLAVHLPVDRAVFVQLLGERVPRLLRNDQDADPELRHDAHRLG